MKRGLKPLRAFNNDLAESFLVNGAPLIRGTPEWDDRERRRRDAGNCCISIGKLSRTPSWQRKAIRFLQRKS